MMVGIWWGDDGGAMVGGGEGGWVQQEMLTHLSGFYVYYDVLAALDSC